MFGKYAAFIVPAYLVTAAVIAILIVVPATTYRRRRAEIERLARRGVGRRSGNRKA